VKYLILIHSNPRFAEFWKTLTTEQQMNLGRGHFALTEELAASGELIVSEGLADPALAKRVTVTDGRAVSTDGPFAEAKEHLAGFYLIECESMERAIEHAAKVPDAEFGHVEVRPVLDLSTLDL
jgi:hypothetical protein